MLGYHAAEAAGHALLAVPALGMIGVRALRCALVHGFTSTFRFTRIPGTWSSRLT